MVIGCGREGMSAVRLLFTLRNGGREGVDRKIRLFTCMLEDTKAEQPGTHLELREMARVKEYQDTYLTLTPDDSSADEHSDRFTEDDIQRVQLGSSSRARSALLGPHASTYAAHVSLTPSAALPVCEQPRQTTREEALGGNPGTSRHLRMHAPYRREHLQRHRPRTACRSRH